MNYYDEILARLKTAHMFFGPEGEKRGAELLDKYLLEGAITQEEYEKLLEENREVLDKLAIYLCEKETITGEEFMEILNKEGGMQK